MPHISVNKINVYFEDTGSGDETLTMSHALLWRTHLYDRQIEQFKDRYRCVAYDHRGQGKTEVAKEGYDLDTLTDDAIALIEELDSAPCHFIGTSMGGMVGMRLALRRPEMLKSLVLLGANTDPETSSDLRQYAILNLILRWFGVRPVIGVVMSKFFGTTFRTDPAFTGELAEAKAYMLKNDRLGAARAMKGVLNRESIYDKITGIRLPTLVLDGEEDVLVPGKAERIHHQIDGSTLVKIPLSGHSPTVENPGAVNTAIEEFLATL